MQLVQSCVSFALDRRGGRVTDSPVQFHAATKWKLPLNQYLLVVARPQMYIAVDGVDTDYAVAVVHPIWIGVVGKGAADLDGPDLALHAGESGE